MSDSRKPLGGAIGGEADKPATTAVPTGPSSKDSKYNQRKQKKKQRKRRKQLVPVVEPHTAKPTPVANGEEVDVASANSTTLPSYMVKHDGDDDEQPSIKRSKANAKKKQSTWDKATDAEEGAATSTHSLPGGLIPSTVVDAATVRSTANVHHEQMKWWNNCPADVFAHMIAPITPEQFFSEYWEKKPLLIRRKSAHHYKSLFTSSVIDGIIRHNYLKYGVNIDLARYENFERTTPNPEGRVTPQVVWAMFEDGCSVRMLNPQTFHKPVWKLTSTLQEYFGCMVGVNSYLTPKGCQGFAPHYDDIEAFVLQLEGEKHWLVYDQPDAPRLARHSSANLSHETLAQPILDVVLRPGDLLYFPRGIVHQAKSVPDKHSLHITASTYQLFDWTQYLEKLVPGALAIASAEDVSFRQGLPLNVMDYVGISKTEEDPTKREKFIKTAKRLLTTLVEHAPFDEAMDQLAVDNLHNSMPPCLTEQEKLESGRIRTARDSKHNPRQSIPPVSVATLVKPIRKYCARLVIEGDVALVYHSYDNGMYWHAEEPQSIQFSLEHAPILDALLNAHEMFTRVGNLPGESDEERCDVVTALFDAGLLLRDDDDDEDDPDFTTSSRKVMTDSDGQDEEVIMEEANEDEDYAEDGDE
eukprot:m.207633 g.207633  ORF g.207633 m.207633 type:complete len:640 (+) comp15028_c2_seq1:123-2042(+)